MHRPIRYEASYCKIQRMHYVLGGLTAARFDKLEGLPQVKIL
jgi:hypothetical protein